MQYITPVWMGDARLCRLPLGSTTAPIHPIQYSRRRGITVRYWLISKRARSPHFRDKCLARHATAAAMCENDMSAQAYCKVDAQKVYSVLRTPWKASMYMYGVDMDGPWGVWRPCSGVAAGTRQRAYGI